MELQAQDSQDGVCVCVTSKIVFMCIFPSSWHSGHQILKGSHSDVPRCSREQAGPRGSQVCRQLPQKQQAAWALRLEWRAR